MFPGRTLSRVSVSRRSRFLPTGREPRTQDYPLHRAPQLLHPARQRKTAAFATTKDPRQQQHLQPARPRLVGLSRFTLRARLPGCSTPNLRRILDTYTQPARPKPARAPAAGLTPGPRPPHRRTSLAILATTRAPPPSPPDPPYQPAEPRSPPSQHHRRGPHRLGAGERPCPEDRPRRKQHSHSQLHR